MIKDFSNLQHFFSKTKIKFEKYSLKHIAQTYSFYHISKKSYLQEEMKQMISQNIKNSMIMIIDQSEKLNEETKEQYLIISFEKTLILLDQSSIAFVDQLLSTNSKTLICFLSTTQNVIKIDKNRIIEADHYFTDEVSHFIEYFNHSEAPKIWTLITPCISGYLIKKSYLQKKSFHVNQFIDIENISHSEIMNENEYIEIRDIGTGGVFSCWLIYHISRGELYAIKKLNGNHSDAPKLINRENLNYSKIHHPLIPKFLWES